MQQPRPDRYFLYLLLGNSNGVNRKAVIALVIAIAPVVPGFLRAATTPGGQVASPGVLDTLYTYAWFITFAIGFVVYYALMARKSAEY